jgi:hypothetical protein
MSRIVAAEHERGERRAHAAQIAGVVALVRVGAERGGGVVGRVGGRVAANGVAQQRKAGGPVVREAENGDEADNLGGERGDGEIDGTHAKLNAANGVKVVELTTIVVGERGDLRVAVGVALPGGAQIDAGAHIGNDRFLKDLQKSENQRRLGANDARAQLRIAHALRLAHHPLAERQESAKVARQHACGKLLGGGQDTRGLVDLCAFQREHGGQRLNRGHAEQVERIGARVRRESTRRLANIVVEKHFHAGPHRRVRRQLRRSRSAHVFESQRFVK